MIRRLGIYSLCAAIAGLSFTAGAADRLWDDEIGMYGGVGLGYGTFENEDFLTEDNELRDDRTTWQAFIGGRFIPWLGIEASYVDFGEIDGEGGFLDADGMGAALGVYVPVGRTVTLSARAGQLWW
ncbi:MAG TPA: outer membrane beta-barrel protein, partial [Gammaproteobacteria bacterium]